MRHFASYEELEAFLHEWISWEGDMYDFGGVVGLLEACLANIRERALEGDLEEFADRLAPENRATLVLLARLVMQRGSQPDDAGE